MVQWFWKYFLCKKNVPKKCEQKINTQPIRYCSRWTINRHVFLFYSYLPHRLFLSVCSPLIRWRDVVPSAYFCYFFFITFEFCSVYMHIVFIPSVCVTFSFSFSLYHLVQIVYIGIVFIYIQFVWCRSMWDMEVAFRTRFNEVIDFVLSRWNYKRFIFCGSHSFFLFIYYFELEKKIL